ncbi:VOC family protein [Veronia pacifica]|uniref:Glyoxalase n=1 Tax=Veronia pacifica TaxID=1080227 RepID=A0A1C3ER35_9GAMM|nr:VOC family protein [Veronia pacifica]ODA35715.1 glyoxalase [Veronia pacifica]
MNNLNIVEIKPFVPAKNFDVSKKFYQVMGFEMASDVSGVAYFKRGDFSFLLQDFYHPDHSDNFMMHLLVEDIESWHQHLQQSGIAESFSTSLTEIIQQPWGMRECCLVDPSGVLWRVAQNI